MRTVHVNNLEKLGSPDSNTFGNELFLCLYMAFFHFFNTDSVRIVVVSPTRESSQDDVVMTKA